MALTLVLIIFCFLVFSQLFSLRNRKLNKIMEKFPGPSSLPLIGNLWMMSNSTDRYHLLTGVQKKYGNRVAINLIFTKFLLVFHPDDVAKILGSHEVNKSRLYDLLFKDWLGPKSVLFAKSETVEKISKEKEHLRLRKMFQPILSYRLVSKFEGKFNEHSKILVRILKEDVAKGNGTEIRWLLTRLAIDTISEYVAGFELNSLTKSQNEFAAAFHREIDCLCQRALSPWLWPEFLWKFSSLGRKEEASREFLHNYTSREIQKQKTIISSQNGKPFIAETKGKISQEVTKFSVFQVQNPLEYFLRKQLEGELDFTDDLIQELTNSMIFAGHETVASSLIFTILQLAANPKEQANLQRELDEIFENDRHRDVESEDLPKLVFLEACIKEALRLFSPGPLLPRKLTQDLHLDDGTKLIKGMEIAVSSWVTHRLPEFYPEPEKFRPSRFLPENSLKMHPYAFLAFSAGPRSCLGQKFAIVQEKIILSHIFRNFKVELVSPAENVILKGEIVIFPKDPLYVKFKPR